MLAVVSSILIKNIIIRKKLVMVFSIQTFLFLFVLNFCILDGKNINQKKSHYYGFLKIILLFADNDVCQFDSYKLLLRVFVHPPSFSIEWIRECILIDFLICDFFSFFKVIKTSKHLFIYIKMLLI